MDFGTRLDNIRVRVTVPGTEIEAELSRRTHIALYFKNSDYAFVNEPIMERALGAVLEQLMAGWHRQYRRAIEYTNLIIDAENSTDLAFFADRDALQASGKSSDMRIMVATVGIKTFSVDIKPDTVRQLSESEFCASFSEAAENMIQDALAKVGELKEKYYG